MLIGKDEISRMIPHAGAMCLLDGVLRWDVESIRCISGSHRILENPLRSDGRLHAICGIEYAAQAMAVHGRLAGRLDRQPRTGYLASLRDLSCRVPFLDSLDGDLVIDAEMLMGDALRVVYRFSVSCGAREALSGRAAVILDAGNA